MCLFRNDRMICTENPKEKKTLKNKCIQQDSMININQWQKAVSFLYRNNECAEIEIESTIPFSVTSKKLKYSRICLTK